VDGDELLDGEVEALGERVGLTLDDGDALDEGDSDNDDEPLGEVEWEIDADGEGLTDGEPSATSTGASTTANATRTTSSVCHAISMSSDDRITRRRKDNQRKLVKVGVVESSDNASFNPSTLADSIRLSATVPSL